MTTEELTKEVEALKQEIQSMKSNGTFPYEIGVAIKDRLGIGDQNISYSSVDSSPSVVSVNEAGTAPPYNVAAPMTGFVYITVTNGNTYKLARY